MNTDMAGVISDILTYHGALIEKTDDGCFEYICPQALSEILEIPEEGNLVFKYDQSCENAVHASYDSDLFSHLEKLFSERGRLAAASFEPPLYLNAKKIEKDVPDKISFFNATFRMDKTELTTVVYLLIFFKFTALSDEKKEGLVPLLINRTNLSVSPIADEALYFINELHELSQPPQSLDNETIASISASFSTATLLVKEKMADFIKSLNRRLNRDIKRVHEYYETLRKETREAIRKKALLIDEYASLSLKKPQEVVKVIDKRIKDKSIKGEGIEKLLNKLDAIDTEKEWKEQDLIDKYTLKLQVEPLTTLYIETPAPVYWITLRRRLSSRPFPVTYNPLLKRLDPLPCESCFYPQSPYYICDDKLHIVCSRCYVTCQSCEKSYCTACHKEKCPKCGQERKSLS